MKKIIILIALVTSVLALLPIIGNQLMNDTLDSKIEMLKSNGIETIDASKDSKYLSTSRHYKFILNDMDKFLKYLSQYSDEQLPPYTSSILKGTVVGVDLSYSNIPFTRAVSLDIYPLTLSTDIMNDIKGTDEGFYNYVKRFFILKGILYHIEYNIVSEKFEGFIKDIGEDQVLKNGSKLLVDISGATFNGSGSLAAPKYLKTDASRLNIDISNHSKQISIAFGEFSSESTFESRNTYDSTAEVKSLSIISKEKNTISINLSNMFVNINSNTRATKAELASKSSFSDLNITSDIFNFNVSDFNSDITVLDIDKDSFEKLRILISKTRVNNSIKNLPMIKDTTIDMLSKGLSLNVKDISVKNIDINGDSLKGFSIKSSLNLKEDILLAKKINYAPLFISQSLDMDFNFRISDKLYSKLAYIQPLVIFAQGYAKKNASDLVFDFTLKDGEFKINGKSLTN